MKKIYIQSAYSMESLEKQNQEKRPLLNIKDNFKKYITEEGIEVISLKEWLFGGE